MQLPLPAHIDESFVLEQISHEKDVDGLHPMNVGCMVLKGRSPKAVSCTPKVLTDLQLIDYTLVAFHERHLQGCIELLKRYNIPIEGKHAVVLGRSNIVGIPVSQLLLQENATVTVCHSRTADVAAIVRQVCCSRRHAALTARIPEHSCRRIS
jgi:methylenetetrahydrofolate dehydrogenase (NADP+)/methenyltetrahydrofolate cyclohydrolase